MSKDRWITRWEPRDTVGAIALGVANGFRCVACQELIGDDARPGQGRERYHVTCWRAKQVQDLTASERQRVIAAYRAMDDAESVTEPSEWPQVGARVRRGDGVWTVVARMGHAAVIELGDRRRMVLATDCEPAGGQGGGLASGPGLSPGVVPVEGGNPRPADGMDMFDILRNTPGVSDVVPMPGGAPAGAYQFKMTSPPIISREIIDWSLTS